MIDFEEVKHPRPLFIGGTGASLDEPCSARNYIGGPKSIKFHDDGTIEVSVRLRFPKSQARPLGNGLTDLAYRQQLLREEEALLKAIGYGVLDAGFGWQQTPYPWETPA